MRFAQYVPLVAGIALLVACTDEGPSNAPPTADFTVACHDLTCQLTDGSTDADGVIHAHVWGFGDGAMSAEPSPVHTYAAPGGQFTVTLTVRDDDGEAATTAKQVTVQLPNASPVAPDRTGTYVRETRHSTADRHSRYVIGTGGTFEVHFGTGADTTIYRGRWAFAGSVGGGGWTLEPASVILFDFDGFHEPFGCGMEGAGVFLLDGHLGIAYCGVMIRAGLEEGVYTSGPIPGTPGPAPPQAGQIAFVRDGRISVANTDGGSVVQLSTGPDDGEPAWSPDGRRIAFTRTIEGTTGVFIMDADGGNVRQRTTSGGDPTWSPDGAWIAFSCPHDICVVKADDEAASPLNITNEPGQVAYPAWSPDGTRIAYTSDWAMFDSWFDIWVVSPDGSHRTALTTHTPSAANPFEHYQAAWSPDGDRIAFVNCPWAFQFCSSAAISVMRADGSGAVRLAVASGFASPTWSPDGRVIAFASGHWLDPTSNTIEWISADGSQRGRIIDNGHSPAWRP